MTSVLPHVLYRQFPGSLDVPQIGWFFVPRWIMLAVNSIAVV